MMRGMRPAIVALGLLAAQPALADECSDALRDYNDMLVRLTDAIDVYTACVRESLGRHDCAKEFADMQSLQRQFVLIVGFYRGNCQVPFP